MILIDNPQNNINIQENLFLNNQAKEITNGTNIRISGAKNSILLQNNTHYKNNLNKGGYGSCVYIYGSNQDITFKNENYTDNNINKASSGYGGAIAIDLVAGQLNVINGSFSHNKAQFGGAIYLYQPKNSIKFTSNYFTENSVQENGGAIYIYSLSQSQIAFDQNQYFSNSAVKQGGAVYILDALNQIIFQNESFVQCSAQQQGGAIQLVNARHNVSFQNNSFLSNLASEDSGGAISIIYPQACLLFSANTFIYNSAQKNAGSLYILQAQDSILIFNDIYTDNNASYGSVIFLIESKPSTTIQIINSNFQKNSVKFDGGVVQLSACQGIINISKSLFARNYASRLGGVFSFINCKVITNFNSNQFLNNKASTGAALYSISQESSLSFESNLYFENFAQNDGGAIFIDQINDRLVFQNCTFESNRANQKGGAIFISNSGSGINFTSNNFTNNSALFDGGALLGIKLIDGLEIQSNLYLRNFAGAKGGAISLNEVQKSLNVNRTQFRNNNAGAQGGALSVQYFNADFFIQGSDFLNNTAVIGGALDIVSSQQTIRIIESNYGFNIAKLMGGAIYIDQLQSFAVLDLNNYFFNKAQFGGCIYINNALDIVRVEYNNFTDNRALVNGGVLYLIDCLKDIILNNNTFLRNQAGQEGGSVYIMNQWQQILVENNKFLNNKAQGKGAGIAVYNSQDTIQIKSSEFITNGAYIGSSLALVDVSKTTSIVDCQFISNFVSEYGGSVYLTGLIGENTSFLIKQSNFQNNNAFNAGGGDIYCQDINSVDFDLVRFQNSTAGIGGSLYFKNNNQIFLNNLIIESSNAINSGAALFVISTSSLDVSNAIISKASSAIGTLYVKDTINIHLQNITVEKSLASDSAAGLFIGNAQNVSIANTTSQNNTAQKQGGGCLFQNIAMLLLDKFKCNNNKALDGNGGCMVLQNIFNLQTQGQQQIIENYASLNGGGIYISNQQNNIILENFFITNNKAVQDGGGLSIQDVHSIEINSCVFINNLAQQGGGLMAFNKNQDIQFKKIIIQDSLFDNNIVQGLGGGVYLSYSQDTVIANTNFTSNNARIAGAIYIALRSGTLASFKNTFTETYTEEYSLKGNVFSKNSLSSKSAYAKDIRIISNSNIQKQTIDFFKQQLQSQNNFQAANDSDISLQCEPGESHDTDLNTCSPCSVGSHSQGGYKSYCQQCAAYTQCEGSYSPVKVDQGYWTSTDFSFLKVLKCNHTQYQCLGGLSCQQGYKGILCEECDYNQGYVRTRSFYCAKCNSTWIIYLYTSASILLTSFLVGYIVYSTVDQKRRHLKKIFIRNVCQYIITIKNNFSVILRLMINHSQLMVILFSIDIQYPTFIKTIYNHVGQPQEALSYDSSCLLNQKDLPPIYQKLIFDHVLASISLAILLLIILIIYIFKKIPKQHLNIYWASVTISLLFYLLPSMYNQLMGLISYRKIDGIEGKQFVQQDISVQWGSPEFKKYTFELVIPLIVFWTIVFVAAIYINVVLGRKFIANQQNHYKINSQDNFINSNVKQTQSNGEYLKLLFQNMFKGYKNKLYFQESIMLFQKFLLIATSHIFNNQPVIITSLCLMVLSLVLFYQMKFKPYQNFSIQKLSNYSQIILIVTVVCLQILYVQNEKNALYYFSFSIIVLTNIVLLAIVLKEYIHEVYLAEKPEITEFINKYRPIKAFIERIKCLKESNLYINLMVKQVRRDYNTNALWIILIQTVKKFNEIKRGECNIKNEQDQFIQYHLNILRPQNRQFEQLAPCFINADYLMKEAFEQWKNNKNSHLIYIYFRWKQFREQQYLESTSQSSLENEQSVEDQSKQNYKQEGYGDSQYDASQQQSSDLEFQQPSGCGWDETENNIGINSAIRERIDNPLLKQVH